MSDRWWYSLVTLVPRERYLKAVRGLSDARARYYDEQAENLALHEVVGTQKEYIAALEVDRQRRAQEMVQVRVALGRVAEYDGGIAETNPVPLLIDGLVRDHEELTARIESVLDLILVRRNDGIPRDGDEYFTLNQIAGLLQGQVKRVPDTVEGLDG